VELLKRYKGSKVRSEDFVISWFREILKTFEIISIFDPTSEFLEMAETMFIGSKLDTNISSDSSRIPEVE